MVEKQIQELVKSLNEAKEKYYKGEETQYTDEEFDQLYRKLQDLETENPTLVLPESPTRNVGYLGDAGKLHTHHKQLLSLGNIFNEEELKDWLSAFPKDTLFAIENKMDGLAVALTYKDRVLTTATLRGDGLKGEIVTHKLTAYQTVPITLSKNFPMGEFEIHGEVTIAKQVLDTVNILRKESGQATLANPRNAVAGMLRSKSVADHARRAYSFHPYGFDDRLAELSGHTSYHNLITLILLEFNAYSKSELQHKLLRSAKEIQEYYINLIARRGTLNNDIDGMVIKVNDLAMRQKYGQTAKDPRWAIAYKFPAIEGVSTLKDVTWQVGRTGVLTPVAEIEPVHIGGVTVSRVTLHNYPEIMRLGIRYGSQISVARQGDVIPKIVKALFDSTLKLILPPPLCPSCGSDVIMGLDENNPRCTNKECNGIYVANILYFVSRKVMNIDWIGEALATKLVESGLVREEPYALFAVTPEQLMEQCDLKEGMATKIYHEIQSKKEMSLTTFINGLSVPYVGATASKALAQHFGTFEAMCSTKGEFNSDDVKGVGNVTRIVWFTHIAQKFDRIYRILELTNHTLSILPVEVPVGPLTGHTYAITGSVDGYTRDELTEQLEAKGATVTNSISNKLTALIATAPSSKTRKAIQLRVKIIGQEDLLKLLEEK